MVRWPGRRERRERREMLFSIRPPQHKVRTFAVKAWHKGMQFDRSRSNGIALYLSPL